MRNNLRLAWVALAAGALAACAPAQQDTGGAKVSVRSNALYTGSPSTVVRVRLNDGNGHTLETRTLGGDGVDTWSVGGTFDNLAVGLYAFCADATDGERTFAARCVEFTVQKNKMARVDIILQQTGGIATINTGSPLIDGLSLSDTAPHYGETVQMTVATSPSVDGLGHNIPVSWTAQCDGGAIRDLGPGKTAELTSSCTGVEHITITAHDLFRDISSIVNFDLVFYPQGANVFVQLNTAPDLTSLTSPDAEVTPSATTTVTAVANDIDHDPVTYAWSASCGTVTSLAGAATFTAPATAGDCTVTVTASDGHGGSVTGSVVIHVVDAILTARPFSTVCNADWSACSSTTSTDVYAIVDGTGLHLSKPSDDATHHYGLGAQILGAAGLTFQSASFDTTGIVAVGTPRFHVSFDGGGECTLDYPTHSGATYTFTLANPGGGTPCTPTGTLSGIYIVADGSNPDPASNAITLTNIKVNGISIIE